MTGWPSSWSSSIICTMAASHTLTSLSTCDHRALTLKELNCRCTWMRWSAVSTTTGTCHHGRHQDSTTVHRQQENGLEATIRQHRTIPCSTCCFRKSALTPSWFSWWLISMNRCHSFLASHCSFSNSDNRHVQTFCYKRFADVQFVNISSQSTWRERCTVAMPASSCMKTTMAAMCCRCTSAVIISANTNSHSPSVDCSGDASSRSSHCTQNKLAGRFWITLQTGNVVEGRSMKEAFKNRGLSSIKMTVDDMQ